MDAVTTKTLMFFNLLSSPAGMDRMQMAVMMKRLKAADPTMVPGPSSPDSNVLETVSSTDIMISGALVPNASRDRLATVSFHTCQRQQCRQYRVGGFGKGE